VNGHDIQHAYDEQRTNIDLMITYRNGDKSEVISIVCHEIDQR